MKYTILLFMFIIFSCTKVTDSVNNQNEYYGQIINQSTNQPLENISVTVHRIFDTGSSSLIDTFFTDNEGKFYCNKSYFNENSSFKIWINLSPSNYTYSTKDYPISLNSNNLGKFYIYQFAQLKVEIEQINSHICRLYQIDLPSYGTTFWAGTDTFYLDNRVKGNSNNSIKIKCLLDSNYHIKTDSIYCSIDSVTNYKMLY